MIKTLTIEGFRSVRKLEAFPLYKLNILVGANGAGKTNFIGFLRLVREMVRENLQFFVNKQGRADAHLFLGPKHTEKIAGKIDFGTQGYEFCLEPTTDSRLIFRDERVCFIKEDTPVTRIIGTGHSESRLNKAENSALAEIISGLTFYHFHDTGDTAGVRREHTVRDNEYLRPDAGNLAAFLYDLRGKDRPRYELIRDTVRLAAPFFDDFKLRPFDAGNGDRMIGLEWTQKHTDYPFHTSQLSDGTLRFVCLAAALLQPDPPPVMVFDEPELGLHPEALRILAGLFRQAGARIQIIAATQSASFLNDFEPKDVIVTDREQGATVFRRLSSEDLKEWLEEYSLGELWQKNVFEGGPVSETDSGAGRRTD
jgi:predicted ATPase